MQIALGFALGTFIGVFPSFAVGSFAALYLAGKFGWNQGAALSGTFLMNPITAPFFYGLSYLLGRRLSGAPWSGSASGVLQGLTEFGWTYLLAIFLVAFAASIATGTIAFIAATWNSDRAPNIIGPAGITRSTS